MRTEFSVEGERVPAGRVLHVMESTIGGTRRHLVDVVHGQLAAGLEVHVIAACLRQADFAEDLAVMERAGAGIWEVPMVREIRPKLDLAHQRTIEAVLREVQPQIVHTHSSKAGVLGRRASIRSGIGVRVHTPHTFAFLFGAMFSEAKRRVFRAIETHLAKQTGAVIAVSESEAKSFRVSGVVPRDRVRVVENGVDVAPYQAAQAAPRAELDLPEGVPVCGVFGLFNVAKGQDLALEALAAAESKDVHLVLAGSGETEAECRELAASLGVADRVRFVGFRKDVPALLKTVDWLVLPSRWEGMPYIVLEAMAAGRPVLATQVDGARDLVEHDKTGQLVYIEDPGGLARGIDNFARMSAKEREGMGQAGAERVRSRYSTRRMVQQLNKLYGELNTSAEWAVSPKDVH